MEVVLRPADDAFLTEVVFPSFELGVVQAAPALEHLLAHLGEDPTRTLVELVLEQAGAGSFFGLVDERWNQAVYRLLFHQWELGPGGWVSPGPWTGYAGPWEETFHLALMLEDPDYPYADEHQAELYRRAFWGQPKRRYGLPTLLCGAWDPIPSFPPDQVLTGEGNGLYDPGARLARADWSWRAASTVGEWAERMGPAAGRLLDREVRRLAPVEPPERLEVLDYWLGRAAAAPVLAVTFSGLGPRAGDWIRELGSLGEVVRQTAARGQGLTAVISRRSRGREPGGMSGG